MLSTTKQALVCGGTSGLGRSIAVHFAKEKINVTIIGRSKQAGKEIVQEMQEYNPHGAYEMIECDASKMKEIVKVCDEFKKSHSRLDYCILSQGIATLDGRVETAEGIDKKMALHYYGRILFVRELLDVMRNTSKDSSVKVMSVLSAGKYIAYTNVDDLDLKQNFSLLNASNACSFYNDLAMDKLSRDEGNENIGFIHSFPGGVATQWGRDFPWYLRWPIQLFKPFITSPEEYGKTVMKEILLNDARNKGFHCLGSSGEVVSTTKYQTEHYRDIVWNHTNELIDKALTS